MPSEYPIHSVKQDLATGTIAQRTGFDDDERAWQVFRLDGVLPPPVPEVDVADWVDLQEVPPPGPP